MSTPRAVCDGWDVPAVTSAGERVTLHFLYEPSAVDIASALADYEAAMAAAAALQYEIELEDGSYA